MSPHGASVEAPAAPEKEGHTFGGWKDVPQAMPAKDITYRANIESGIFGIYGDISKMNVYDLEGRKIDNPERLKSGVYIINGKRVLLK